MSKVAVSGSIAYDHIMDFPGHFKDHIMADKIHALSVSFTIDKIIESFGGVGGNVAYNLALLGVDAELYAAVGTDFERYRDRLHGMGIGTANVQTIENEPTAAAYIITDKVDNQITGFHAGAARSVCLSPHNPACTLAIIGASSAADMTKRAEMCRAANVPYLFDPGQQITELNIEQLRDILTGAAAVFGNDYEIEMVLKKSGWTIIDIVKRVPIVVTTLGITGSRILTEEKEFHIESVRVANSVDPTGAGDAYRAGFIKGYLSKFTLSQTAQLASAVASFCVEHKGTQAHTFTIEELGKRYEHAYGEALPL